MFRYYVLIAWRLMKRHKIYSIINVLGLATGICACMIIYLVTSHEFSFDRFHLEKDRIFRITGEVQRLNGEMEFVNSLVPDVAGIETAIPGFEAKTGIWHYDASVKVPKDNGKSESFPGDNVIVTAPDYFKIFQYKWVAGDPASSLTQPNTVVITEKRARQLFGDVPLQQVPGKILVYNDSLNVTVTGVIKDWTSNTDLNYTDFISLETANDPFLKKEIASKDWSSLRPHGTMAFVKLDKNTSAEKINALLKDYLDKNAKAAFYGKLVKLQLQSLTDLHFTSSFNRVDDGDGFRKAHLPTLYMLIGIAFFILILAVVNFVNLSTALSLKRSKEIGMRKVLGVPRKNLVIQMLIETFLFTALAVIVACACINPVMALFKNYLPQGVMAELTDARLILFLFAITVITTLLAGLYPAKVLSSVVPAISLKGVTTVASPGNVVPRKALIVFQFAVSLIFIIATLVMNHQLDYMRSKDKGFTSDAIITINNWGAEPAKMQVLKEQIKKIAGVENAVLQGDPPMGFAERSSILKYKDKNVGEVEVITKLGDENFISFYKMKLIAGRNILKSDSLNELIINETCARVMGYSNVADAVGKYMYANNEMIPIVGVVADFHMGSFHTAIRPMVIQHNPQWETSLAVSVSSLNNIGETRKVISDIEKVWTAIYPQQDFQYTFLDDYIGWLFEKEEQAAWLMNAAMIITIFISCMGLFGLAMYMAERRTREIGIRKVLGASVFSITTMLSKEFARLVLVATIIASPVAWYVMDRWLEDFVYRVNVSWWIFLAALVIALMIAMLTVSYQAIKAAMANPVKNLRTE